MKKTNLLTVMASLFVLAVTNPIMATEPVHQQETITDSSIFAQVNGVNLSSEMFAFLLASREKEYSAEDEMTEPGHADQAGLRAKTARDLIMTTLLAQQAANSNMHNAARFQLELALFEQTLLAQLYVQHLMENMDIEEALIRQRHEQQPQQTLYRFMIWETTDGNLATSTLEALKPGDRPHTPNARVTEVETPWLLGSDIDPQVQAKIAPLGINDFVPSPILQDGVWKVVQLIDKRTLDRQSYEDERDIIRAEIVSEKLEEALEGLFAQAQITVNEAFAADLSHP